MGESHLHKKGTRQELTKSHRNWILDFYKESPRLDFRRQQLVTDIGFKTITKRDRDCWHAALPFAFLRVCLSGQSSWLAMWPLAVCYSTWQEKNKDVHGCGCTLTWDYLGTNGRSDSSGYRWGTLSWIKTCLILCCHIVCIGWHFQIQTQGRWKTLDC